MPASRLDIHAHFSQPGTPEQARAVSEPNVEDGIEELRTSAVLSSGAAEAIGRRGFDLFSGAARRAGISATSPVA